MANGGCPLAYMVRRGIVKRRTLAARDQAWLELFRYIEIFYNPFSVKGWVVKHGRLSIHGARGGLRSLDDVQHENRT